MKRIQKMLSLALALAMMMSLVSCGNNATPAGSAAPSGDADAPAKTADALEVAYLLPSAAVPFWVYLQNGIQEKCDEYGYNLTVYDSNNEASTQLKNAQNAITTGKDLIIISPCDSSSCPAVLDAAEEAGIPVIVADVGTDSGTYASYISTPNYEGSYEVGQYLANYMKENSVDGTIGEITIPLARKNGQLRQEGFTKAVTEAGFQMGTSLSVSNSTYDEAEGFCQNIISGDPNCVAIWSHQETSTVGIITALEGMNEKDILVACFDGSPIIVDYIREGKVLCCGAQQPVEMGRQALEAGKTYIETGSCEPEIGVPTLLITAENVEELMPEIEANVYPPGV